MYLPEKVPAGNIALATWPPVGASPATDSLRSGEERSDT
jgi:hypothetical protein